MFPSSGFNMNAMLQALQNQPTSTPKTPTNLFTLSPQTKRQNLFQTMIPAGLSLMAASGPSTDPGAFSKGLAATGQNFFTNTNALNNQSMQRNLMNYNMQRQAAADKRAAQLHPLSMLSTLATTKKALQGDNPSSIREMGMLQAAMRKYKPGTPEYNTAAARLSKLTTRQQQFANPFDAAQATQFFGQGEAINENAVQSAKIFSDLGVAEDLIKSGVDTGFGTTFVNKAREIGSAVGFDVDQANVTGNQLLTSIINQTVAPLVKQLGTNPTDRDLAFIVGSFPSIEKTSEGNIIVLRALRRNAKRNMLMQKAYQEAVQKRDPQSFYKAQQRIIAENPILSQQDRDKIMAQLNPDVQSKLRTKYGVTLQPLPGQ